MTNESRDAEALGLAIRRACSEHGVPNTFGFGELCGEYLNISPMRAGQVFHRRRAEVAKAADLDARQLTREDGRICVTEKPQ